MTKPDQKIAFAQNKKRVKFVSQKQGSIVDLRVHTEPFRLDNQVIFALLVHNRKSSESITIGADDLKCYVNGKEVRIISREEKLAHLHKQMNKGGGKVGKKILAAFAANLANTHTASNSYSGYVGNHYYSGTATSSYTDHRGAVADNVRLSRQIDAEHDQRKAIYRHSIADSTERANVDEGVEVVVM